MAIEELREALYLKRCIIGARRQSSLSQYVTFLQEFLKQEGIIPFGKGFVPHDRLKTIVDCYDPGAHWLVANLAGCKYLYRIETLASFLNKHKGLFRKAVNGGYGIATSYQSQYTGLTQENNSVKEIMNPDEAWENIKQRYRKQNHAWLPLHKLVNRFFAYRGFSWWTADFPTDGFEMPLYFEGEDVTTHSQWIINLAHRVGIANDWLDDQLLLLRYDYQKIEPSLVHVPSVVDGFCQLIFDPQTEPLKQEHGVAIHLQEDLTPGYREVVVQNAVAEYIEFIPVAINSAKLDKINRHARINNDLLKKLINYLENESPADHQSAGSGAGQ